MVLSLCNRDKEASEVARVIRSEPTGPVQCSHTAAHLPRTKGPVTASSEIEPVGSRDGLDDPKLDRATAWWKYE
jgi:hypothetical protein